MSRSRTNKQKRTKLGAFQLSGPNKPQRQTIKNFAKDDVLATVIPWNVEGPDGLLFTVNVVWFDDSEEAGQVYCDSRHESPQEWEGIVRRLRVGIRHTEDGLVTMDLRCAISGIRERAAKKILPLVEINRLVGFKLENQLKKLGAIGVGTRELVLGETGRMRGYPCVTFEPDDAGIAAAAFVGTTMCAFYATLED